MLDSMPPGTFVDQRLRVGRHGLGVDAAGVDILLLDGLEEVVDFVDDLLVQTRLDAVLTECIEHRLGSGLGGAVGEAGGCAVDDVDAGLNCLGHGHIRHAGGAVGMEDQRHIADGVLDALDEVLCLIRAHRACHILQADGVKAHVLELFAHLDILFHGVDRALRVGDAAGSNGVLAAVFLVASSAVLMLRKSFSASKIRRMSMPFFDRQLDELFHNVVVIVLVAEQVLSAKEHLQLRVGHQSADIAQALHGSSPR